MLLVLSFEILDHQHFIEPIGPTEMFAIPLLVVYRAS